MSDYITISSKKNIPKGEVIFKFCVFLLFAFMIYLSFTFQHESAHKEIYRTYGIDSEIHVNPNILSSQKAYTKATSGVENCSDNCVLAHNINEIVGYHLAVFIDLIIFFGFFYFFFTFYYRTTIFEDISHFLYKILFWWLPKNVKKG